MYVFNNLKDGNDSKKQFVLLLNKKVDMKSASTKGVPCRCACLRIFSSVDTWIIHMISGIRSAYGHQPRACFVIRVVSECLPNRMLCNQGLKVMPINVLANV